MGSCARIVPVRRREWMRMLAGGALVGLESCGIGISGGGKGEWSRDELKRADVVARGHGCRGWAAWEGRHLEKSWRTHERGPVLSITKSLAGLACAKAATEGWMGADERVAATISEWRGDGGKEAVTVRMLLQQVAGLAGGAKQLYRRNIADKGKVAVSLPQVDAPETIFRYGPACWEVLAELIARKTAARGETLEGFLQRAVLRPIRLNSPEWRSDGKGRLFLSTGAELTVTDLGRLGRTLGDLLAGRDTIGIGAGEFRSMARSSRVNPMFGGGMWLNRNAARARPVEIEEVLDPPKGRSFWGKVCISRHQATSLVALVGSSGQRVFIWPESDQVVARLGFSGSWKDGLLLGVL